MRTLELRDEIFERAVQAAKRRGMSVEELVEGALVRDLGTIAEPPSTGHRVEFPLIDSGLPGTLNITPETIRHIEFEDDLRRSGLLGYE